MGVKQLAQSVREYALGRCKEDMTVPDWITGAAQRAKQISKVSHAIKYTHSSAKGSGFFLETEGGVVPYVSSNMLDKLQPDFEGNAATFDVANFLLLEANGKSLLDYVAEGDNAPFKELGTEDQISEWMSGLSKVLEQSAPESHSLAKQLYYPISENKYHLLAPLSASSLHQVIFDRIHYHRFSEEAKEIRDLKRKGLYSPKHTRDFPKLATQTFGGTKPQNISLLNSKRGGKLYLFNAQPPSWKTQLRPPANSTILWKEYGYRIRHLVRELKAYLERVGKAGINNMEVRNKRAEYIRQIVDELHGYAANIWQLPAGWSAAPEIQLTLAERCWLDINSTDEEVLQARVDRQWCEDIAKNFAQLIGRVLTTDNLVMADDEKSHFQKQITNEIQGLTQDLEVMA